MKIKLVEILLCEACLNGEGSICDTPGCAFFLHNSPGHPIAPELYEVKDEWEVADSVEDEKRIDSGGPVSD